MATAHNYHGPFAQWQQYAVSGRATKHRYLDGFNVSVKTLCENLLNHFHQTASSSTAQQNTDHLESFQYPPRRCVSLIAPPAPIRCSCPESKQKDQQ